MAAKSGGPDLIANKALADAIEAARAVSFPKDTMQKSIERATSGDQADFKASTFEAYGHGGAAIYIDVLTDNSNRAAADIRTAVNKSGMKVASPGSVAFNFERRGVIRIPKASVKDEDELLMDSIDAGAEECEIDPADESFFRIIAQPTDFNGMMKGLKEKGYEFELPQVEMIPKTWVEVGEDDMDLNMVGVDALQALDDVDGVYINTLTK